MKPLAANISSLNGIYLRELERSSIIEFLEQTKPFMRGAVLDYGCGKQPYKDLILSADDVGYYYPYDRIGYPGSAAERDHGAPYPLEKSTFDRWGTIVCTQVLQYVNDVRELLLSFVLALEPAGHLIMTYPTTWPEVEPTDLHRFTKTGMEYLLKKCGFSIMQHTPRAVIPIEGFILPLGYGVMATPC
jgi:hypothetical protein